MLTVSKLFIYPIKSLGGISLDTAKVTERGLEHDRRWMLVDKNNEFITQRTFPLLALLQAFLEDNGLLIQHRKNGSRIAVPLHPSGSECKVTVWSDICKGIEVNTVVSEWFSDILSIKCRLIFMPDSTKRRVDSRYAYNKEITSFADGYPFLILGQSSLDDLNNRMAEKLPVSRFRPNIVFKGGNPFEEDEWQHFSINRINFYGVKLCARCVITTIDQNEAIKGKEPLQTLATYRMFNKRIYFGQNLVHKGEGIISTGDIIEVKERKTRS